MRRICTICVFGVVALGVGLFSAAQQSASSVGWLSMAPPGPSVANSGLEAAWEELSGLSVSWLDKRDIYSLLKKQDARKDLLGQAGKLFSEGKELHLGLKMEPAIERFQQTVELLEKGFVRYYEPGRMAEPLLQLGVAQLQAGLKEQAKKSFMRVIAFSPNLQLSQGYYGPSVRRAFAEARQTLGDLQPGAIPTPKELSRICDAAKLRGLVGASIEQLGARPVIRLSLFDATHKDFVAVETTVVAEEDAQRSGREVAVRLRQAVARMVGIEERTEPESEPEPAVNPESEPQPTEESEPELAVEPRQEEESRIEYPDGGIAEVPDGGQQTEEVGPAKPWYRKHWWIWPVAAAVVTTAIVLPLTVFREDVVDVQVRK